MISRRRTLAPLAACALALALVAAGCGDSAQSTAFEVNGQRTTQHDFDRELDAIADNEEFATAYEQLGSSVRNSEGTVSAQLASEWATLVIQQEIMAGALADDDVEVTDEDRAEAETEAQSLFGQAEAGAAAWDAFPSWFQDRVVDRLAAQVAYIRTVDGAPTDEDIEAFYQENVGALVEQCASGKFVSHVLVETEEEAQAILAELDTGASFADLARERSTEPAAAQSAGFLDCFQEGAYVAEFEGAVVAAEVGATVGPVETQFGWHVIRVDAEPPLEGVRAQIASALGSRAQQDAFQALIDDADVELDARYGTWVVENGVARVDPPQAAIDDEPAPEPGELEIPGLDEQPTAP